MKPKARSWMYHLSSPEDFLLQLFSSLQRGRAEPEHDRDSPTSYSTSGRELMELMLTYNGNDNDTSDSDDGGGGGVGGGDEDGEEPEGECDASSGPEDFFS